MVFVEIEKILKREVGSSSRGVFRSGGVFVEFRFVRFF